MIRRPPRSTLFPYHDALPISALPRPSPSGSERARPPATARARVRSEEHTSELQSQSNLVCRLLLEKKKKHKKNRVDLRIRHDGDELPYSIPDKFEREHHTSWI